MLALGEFRFSLDTAAFQSLQRTTEWSWAEAERAGAIPSLQYTGPGRDSITLQGVIYPEYRGGFAQIDAMRTQAGRGEPLDLVDGGGGVRGAWVIKSITEGRESLYPNGQPRKQTFSLSLQRYEQ
ncbi:MAG: phage tail protein [Gammaproteobacteria bacterium]|nr:phage tail protein [Gammaproteobacteria bacterium]